MTLRHMADMAHDDEQLYDLAKDMPKGYEPPEYPSGLCFSIPKSVLDATGGEDGSPDDTMRFSAMGEVTSVFRGRDNCRVELRLTQFAGEDGKFTDLDEDDDRPWMTPSICLCGPELGRMDLEADCELGDTIHLIGTVRLESLSNDGFSGEQARLQVIQLACEDESTESTESREG